jgi:hypothetical protein
VTEPAEKRLTEQCLGRAGVGHAERPTVQSTVAVERPGDGRSLRRRPTHDQYVRQRVTVETQERGGGHPLHPPLLPRCPGHAISEPGRGCAGLSRDGL